MYYQSDNITLYHGDCLDVLPTLTQQFDICYTSPPYNVGLEYESRLSQQEFDAFNTTWLTYLYRVMAESSRTYVFIMDRMLPFFTNPPLPWRFTQLLTWCKPNFVGTSGRIGNDWNEMSEYAVLYRKGKRTPMMKDTEHTTHNWFVYPSPQSNFHSGRWHPAQQPLPLIRHILSRTPGEVVLDPFAGSGSTLIAATQVGKKAVGIEKDEGYCKKIVDRIQHHVPVVKRKQEELL